MSPVAYVRYAIVFVAVAVGVAVAVSLLQTNSETTLGTSAQLMVPAMIGALIEGGQFARGHKRRLTSSEAWNFAFIATAIATVLNVLLSYLGGDLLTEFGRLAIAPFASKQFIILLGLYALGYLLCNRFFAGIGASNQTSIMRNRGEIE